MIKIYAEEDFINDLVNTGDKFSKEGAKIVYDRQEMYYESTRNDLVLSMDETVRDNLLIGIDTDIDEIYDNYYEYDSIEDFWGDYKWDAFPKEEIPTSIESLRDIFGTSRITGLTSQGHLVVDVSF